VKIIAGGSGILLRQRLARDLWAAIIYFAGCLPAFFPDIVPEPEVEVAFAEADESAPAAAVLMALPG
jgi:hypothetical protein